MLLSYIVGAAILVVDVVVGGFFLLVALGMTITGESQPWLAIPIAIGMLLVGALGYAIMVY